MMDESISYKERRVAARELRLKILREDQPFAYCLMPNHFHFLLQQKNETDMSAFVQAVMTRFADARESAQTYRSCISGSV